MADVTAAKPRRRLTLFDVLCIGVNAIVGSGVFSLPDDMHREMGGWSPLAFVLCAALLMPVALCFAELSGRHDDTGGAYLYARNAFGPTVGYVIGWYCWMNTFVSWAANTTLFVELVGFRAYPLNKIVVASTILALGAVNYVGVKPGALLVNIMTVGKLTAILCFVAVGIMAFDPKPLGGALPHGLAGVGQGVYLALFPLQGFEVAPITAGETANPRRNVPLGTMGSLLFSAVLFIVVQAVLIGTYSDLGKDSVTPLADAARRLGPTIGAIVLVGGIVSIGGFTAGSALGSPRYAQAIAADGMLPRRLASLHDRFGTPYIAIVVTTVLSAALGFFYDYRRLVGMSNVTIVFQYFFTCLAVPFLRKKMAGHERAGEKSKAWVIPGGPIVPVIGCVGSAFLILGANFAELVFAAATLALGVVVAVATQRAASGGGTATAPPASGGPAPPGTEVDGSGAESVDPASKEW